MSKPASGTVVNASDPLATSLVAAWGLLEGSGTTSADGTGNGHTLTLASSGYWSTNGSGENILHITAANATPAAVTSPIAIGTTTTWSVAWRAKQASSGNAGMICGNTANTNEFVWLNGTQVSYRNANGLGVNFTGQTPTTVANYVMTSDGAAPTTSFKLYKNGSLVSTLTVGSSSGSGWTINTVGNAYTGNSFSLIGDLEYLYVWSGRVLTLADAGTLNTSPYGLFASSSNSPPSTPTISAGTPTTTGVTLTSSAFADPDVGDTHAASQWQVTTSGDTGYASPAVSTGDDATDKTSYAASGLTPSTAYIARVRYKDSAGNYSSWSSNASFTTATPAASITLTGPPRYKTFQRSSGVATIAGIAGTYTGTPAAIEARWNGGTWATIVAGPSGGTFSGASLASQAQGQGTLEVRFTNDTSTSASVLDVGIGDVFLVAGQSNAEGRLVSPQSYSHATLKATVFREDDLWADGIDPTDTGTLSGGGSLWPRLATHLLADLGVPVAFVTTAAGSTGLHSSGYWLPPSGTGYVNSKAQVTQSGCGGIRAVLWYQGEADVLAGTVTRSQYLADLVTLADAYAADLAGAPKLLAFQIGYAGATVDEIRLAISDAWDAGGNVLGGPAIYDKSNATHPGDTLPTLAVGLLQSDRIWAALKAALYGGGAGPGRGPKATGATWTGSNVTVAFDATLKAGLTLTASLWSVTSNGSPATVSSASYSGSTVTLTCSAPLAGTVLVSYGLGGSTAGKVAPPGPDVTLPGSAGTINLPSGPFSALAAVAVAQPSGIATGEAGGTPSLAPGAVAASPGGISTGEVAGPPSLTPGPIVAAPGGIGTGEAGGTPTSAPGPIDAAPGGIPSGEAIGSPTLSGPDTSLPPGVPSGEAAGIPGLSPGPIDASPGGIPEAEVVGTPSASGNTSGGAGSVAPGGIATGEHVGSPTLSAPTPTFGLVGNWPRSLFPASIFPRSIFPGPASPAPPGPEPAAVAGPDWMVLDDVVARLLATRAFEEAAWGANLELLFPESSYPAAAVEYVGTSENPVSDLDFMVKDGRYTLTIAARGEDMRGRSAALQALAATARNALSGVSLAGICQPYFCRLREDGPADASPPEARLRLVGSYRYTIEDDDSRDDSLD